MSTIDIELKKIEKKIRIDHIGKVYKNSNLGFMAKLMDQEDGEYVKTVLLKIIALFKLSEAKNYETTINLLGLIMEAEYEKFENIQKCHTAFFALLIEFMNLNKKRKIKREK